MTNAFYNPTGNPATGSEALSSLVRQEFVLIGNGFDQFPQLHTTGAYTTTFAQSGNNTYTLPSSPGTLALLSDITVESTARAAADTAEATARAAADTTLTNNLATANTNIGTANTNIAANTAAIALKAPLASPALTGSPTAPTQLSNDNSTKLATTAWVAAFLSASGYAPTGASPVTSVAGRTGAVVLTHNDLTDWAATLASYALLAGPTFTGVPAAPTAGAGTNSTQIATTAFVGTAVSTAIATEVTNRNTAISNNNANTTLTGTTTGAAANFSGNVTALNYGAIRGTTCALTGALTGTSAAYSSTLSCAGLTATTGTFSGAMTGAGGAAVVLSNGGTYAINITGTSAGCSGNSATATTATNVSGGSASVTGLGSTGGANITGASTFMTAPNVAGGGASVHIVTRTDCFPAVFQYVAGTTVGSVSTNGTSVSYNSTSDYRTKTTYGPWLDDAAFDRVPVHFAAFKTTPDVRQPMFLAHELAESGFAFAVLGEKDGAEMQQVDHPSLIPALWAMVQDLRSRVAQLEGSA
jgi:hypothetical protein